MNRHEDVAASFDDRAEPAQATPAGGVAEEVPHDGRASATPPPSAASSYEFARDDDEAITDLWEAIRDMKCECQEDHMKAFGLLVNEAHRG